MGKRNLFKNREIMEVEHFKDIVNQHGLSDFDSIPPSKSQWPGDESDPDSDTEEDAKAKGDFSLLLFAAAKNRMDLLKGLYDSGILTELINQQDEDGYSALHRAAYSNAFQASVFLLEKGSSVNLKTNDGWTPLHSAARWNCSQVAALLLSHGAGVNAKTNGGTTPIQLAVSEKNYNAVVEVLVSEPNLDVNSLNE